MQKVILLLLIVFSCTSAIYASYEKNYPVKIEQPDGSIIQCYITGDEFYQRVHDENGYTIIRDAQTGYLVYAALQNDELVSSGYFVGQTDPQLVGLIKGVDISATKREQIRKDFLKQTPEKKILPGYENTKAEMAGHNNGTLNNIVVFIRFSDQPEFTTNLVDYDDMFNKDEENFSSMYKYFKDVSYNQTLINSTFYPSNSGNSIVSYVDTYPRAYYMPYHSQTNPEGYTSDQAEREHSLLRRAIESISSQIPSDLDLDFNNDGYVDNICFIVKGATTAWNTLLWPHKWSLYSYNVNLNGKRVWTYNFQLEDHLDYSATSVLTHEMFHSLGAPDLYRYSYEGITPVGPWDLMGSNANPPQSTTAHMKYKYGGWIDEIPEITSSGTYTLNNIWAETDNCYKIPSPYSSREYFVIEYRDQNVFWDMNIPGSGLIISRINTRYNGNSDGPPDEVYIFRPGGYNNETEGDLYSANFSANTERTEFHNASNPPCFLSDNSPGGIYIDNISVTGNTMSFHIDLSPIIIPSRTELDFGEASIAEPSNPMSVAISGTFLTNNMTYEITGEDADVFSITEVSWDPLKGGQLNVIFSPDEVKNFNASIVFSSTGAETKSISLTGNGIIIPIVAKFTSNKKAFWTGEEIQFTDQSSGNPTSWNWTFEGGEPSSSTLQNPKITYNTPGIYKVTLLAANSATNDEITELNYISVEEPGNNFVCNSGFEFWTNRKPDCWFGSKTDFTINNATQDDQNHYEGNYSIRLANLNHFTFRRFTTQKQNVENEKYYYIKFHARGYGEISTALYDGRSENSGFSPENEIITLDSDIWNEYSQIVRASRTTSDAEFVFLVKKTSLSNNHLQIDNVIIAEKDLDVPSNEFPDLEIYPNPTEGLVYINSEENIHLEIYSITGSLILTKDIISNDVIDLRNQPKGIYMLKATNTKGNNKSLRLVVQ